MRAFTSRSSRTLNCPSNLIGHDHPNNRPENGTRMIRQSVGGLAIRSCALLIKGRAIGRKNRFPLLLIARWDDGKFDSGQGPHSGEGGNDKKGELRMFQGQIDLDAAIAVEATAIPDVLFERGLYWASGRSGVVNLVAAHKWFNLAALKGRADAISMRREVAAMMSDAEIATAQREARAWMTAH